MPILRTAIIGFGKIAAGNSDDPIMGKVYRYPSHASALMAHPSFSLDAVVDPSLQAREYATERWGIKNTFAQVDDLFAQHQIDVVVISSPPAGRLAALELFPKLKALIVEKPLGNTFQEAEKLAFLCKKKSSVVQVNYWRRADKTFRSLQAKELSELIGEIQGGLAIYGNGLRNNGSHIVDFVRMLAGKVVSVQAVAGSTSQQGGPLEGDIQFPFDLRLGNGVVIHMMPVNFNHYRENGLDLWGTKGRLSILEDSRTILHTPIRSHRGLSGNQELANDSPSKLPSTFGEALYELYDNTAKAIRNEEQPSSPIDDALNTEKIIEALFASFKEGGTSRKIVLC